MLATASSDLFSLREAAVLSRLPEDRVRREIERKHIEAAAVERTGDAPRLLFDELRVLYFSMLHWAGDTIKLEPRTRAIARDLIMRADPIRVLADNSKPPVMRRPGSKAGWVAIHYGDAKEAWTLVHLNRLARNRWVEHIDREWSMHINHVIRVDWNAVVDDLGPRIEIYRRGRGRIRSDPEILGGEPVFEGTRLAVRHVGGMRLAGEPVGRITEDYPYLSPEDVEFAALYASANPPVGRPKTANARPS
jgi:uncharacterized protein (DUF433 family)